jgi:hypothetical protein
MKIMIYKYTMYAFSSEASTVHFYRIKMGRIENAERAGNAGKWREMAAVDYFSFPTDRGDWY